MAAYKRYRRRPRLSVQDLVAETLRSMGPVNFTEIAADLQEHAAMVSLLMGNRSEEAKEAGQEGAAEATEAEA